MFVWTMSVSTMHLRTSCAVEITSIKSRVHWLIVASLTELQSRPSTGLNPSHCGANIHSACAAFKRIYARLGVQAKKVKFKSGDATLSLPWVISALDMGSSLQSAANEHLLLHGTSWDKADSIVRSGFDFRRCDRGMYGDGVYFSPAASLMT